jgi:hypothetical protein
MMPQTPVFAIWFNAGLRAASNGVFQPNSLSGLSAMPSAINKIAFNLIHAGPRLQERFQVRLLVVKTLVHLTDLDYASLSKENV